MPITIGSSSMPLVFACFSLASVLYLVSPAIAASADAVLDQYFLGLSNKSVFYTSCRLVGDVKAAIAIGAGETTGIFVIMSRGIVASIGDVRFEDGRWYVDGVSGGIETSVRAAAIGDKLLSRDFRLLTRNQFNLIERDEPGQGCADADAPTPR